MADMQILIVDDSDFDRMILNRAFAATGEGGVALTEATNAASAIELLGDVAFDAVFLDVNLPGETGFAVLDCIRKMKLRTWPFVFMLSSSSHPDDIQQAYASMATAYLTKPADLETLRDVATTCLSLIRQSEQTAA